MTYAPLAVAVVQTLATIARLDLHVLAGLIGLCLLGVDGLVMIALPIERIRRAAPWVPGTYRPEGAPDLNAWAAAVHHRWHVADPAPADLPRLPAPGGPRRREAA